MPKYNPKDFQSYYSASKSDRTIVFEKETSYILSMDYSCDFNGVKKNGSIVWFHKSIKHNIIAYYPKSNKIHIQDKNMWIDNGLNWIINNLIKWKFER